MFDQRTILVTGGTGSFGQKFIAKLLSEYDPEKSYYIFRDEMKQWEMEKTIRRRTKIKSVSLLVM